MSSSAKADDTPQYLLIGEILRPHGVAGEVRMRVLTSYPERLPELKTVYLVQDPNSEDVTEYGLEQVRMHQQYALLKLKTINDRDQAERLRELYVKVSVSDAIPLEDGEVYLYQLMGLEVQTEEGRALGTISEILETGANDVYIVETPEGGEILIPATPETIISTDLEAGITIVRLPEGLLPPG